VASAKLFASWATSAESSWSAVWDTGLDVLITSIRDSRSIDLETLSGIEYGEEGLEADPSEKSGIC
jgi:hypothetical protein